MNCSTPGFPVHHQLPEFTQTHIHRVGDAAQPSHPLLFPSPPAPCPSRHQSLFQHHNSKALILWLLIFFMVQLTHSYMTTGKTIALTIWTFVTTCFLYLICCLGWSELFFHEARCTSGFWRNLNIFVHEAEIKRCLAPWKKSCDQPRQHIKKQRHYFANKDPSSQGSGFSSSHVWMWELDCEEGWAPKNCAFELWCWRRLLRVPWTARRSN